MLLVRFALIFFALNSANIYPKTYLTFTAHPTNTLMGKENFSTQNEIKYYYDEKLSNLSKIILHEKKYLDEIGDLYSWIGYDFDRSNLSAKDILYANAKSIHLITKLYKEYNQNFLYNEELYNYIQEAENYSLELIRLYEETQTSHEILIEKLKIITDKYNLEVTEKKIIELLNNIINNSTDLENEKILKTKQLLNFFKKFKFQPFKGQVRLAGEIIQDEDTYKNIFEIIELLNKVQNYSIYSIIIANFDSIEQIKTIKHAKAKYNIQNIATIPLMESEKDVKYGIKHLKEIINTDYVPQIMKAGSDDTKFSGMASSIINFAELGYAMQNLKKNKKPILFIGMGTSIERLGGPVYFRKMLGNIVGNNETNRTIQGGELESFSTIQSTRKKLDQEIAISNVKSKITKKEIEQAKNSSVDKIIKKYQELYNNQEAREDFNKIIENKTNLAYILDNYRAGSRYKKKITINQNGEIENKFVDIFDSIRAIDFQTAFVLCGMHPEFVPFSYLKNKELVQLHKLTKENRIINTYIHSIYIISKQTDPHLYEALNLPKKNLFYEKSISGLKRFQYWINRTSPDLVNKIDKILEDEQYINYKSYKNHEIKPYLIEQLKTIEDFRNNEISFSELERILHKNNYGIAKKRNLLSFSIKN